jgi:hypothetical protein
MVPDGSVPVQLGRLPKSRPFSFVAGVRSARELTAGGKVAVTFHR